MDAHQTISVALQPHHAKDDLTDLSQAAQIRDAIRCGKSVEEAGRALGISRSTAFRRLSLIQEDIDRGVVNLLAAKGLDLAENWLNAAEKAATKGDHRPAKDALLHAKLIEPVEDSGATRTNIAIVIGTPDQPIRLSPPQVVEAQVVSPLDHQD